MIVRALKGNTMHGKEGRMERGLFMDIDPNNYDPLLFEIIPQSAEDIEIADIDDKGRKMSDDERAYTQIIEYEKYKENILTRYEEENKLARERLNRRQ